MEKQQLLQLIDAILLPDNDIRKDAEKRYNALVKENSELVMCTLSDICATVDKPAAVKMSLTLLKKLFGVNSECFALASKEAQERIKASLLQVLGAAAFTSHHTLAAVCVSALVVKLQNLKQGWDELWSSVFQILGNVDSPSQLKAISCKIIANTAPSLASFFQVHIGSIVAGIGNSLQDPSIEARKGAFDAFMSVGVCESLSQLQELVPMLLNVLQEYLNASSWDEAEELTSKLAEGAVGSSKLFEKHAEALLRGLMEVASTPLVPRNARHMAIEAIVSYCESEPKKVRSVPNFVASFIELLFEYTLEPVMPANWATTGISDQEDNDNENDDEDAENHDSIIGCQSIDRVVSAVGGRKLEALAQRLFLSNIQSPCWKRRNAALLLIMYAAEGMATVLKKHMEDIIRTALSALHDEMGFVRCSALECITQISNDFAPALQKKFPHLVLPELIQCLKDDTPAIATRAARAVDSFFDSLEHEEDVNDTATLVLFQPYVGDLCASLVTLMGHTSYQFLRKDSLSALSSVIITCKTLLRPYVHDLVPVFQDVVTMPDTPQTMSIKCKATECITLLASSVGKEVFAPYAEDVCNYLTQLLQFLVNDASKDDMRLPYALRGWSCMVECLKEDAVPYLQFVLPVVLEVMNVSCDAEIVDADIEDEDEDEDEKSDKNVETMRVIIPGTGVRKIKMHTSLIEEKETAANIISLIVTYVGKDLGPQHLHNIMTSAVELLKFEMNPSIRECGALILEGVLSACELQAEVAAAVSRSILEPLLDQFAEEDDSEASNAISMAISRCLDNAPELVDPEIIKSISDKLFTALQRAIESREEILQRQLGETDGDEDELDALEAEEEEANTLICDSCDLLEKMLERSGTVFAPLFLTTFSPILEKMLQAQEKDNVVTQGLVLLCSVLKHAPDSAANLIPMVSHSVIAFAQSRIDTDLLQSAYYLMNLLLQYFAQNPHLLVQGFIQKVFETFSHHSTAQQSEEYNGVICNAVSTAVTMLSFFYETMTMEQVEQTIARVVSCLPVKEDEVEACCVHEQVLKWIMGGHPVLRGRDEQAREIVNRLRVAPQGTLNAATLEQLSLM